jgi:light-regulated signal transduction histidine kinase (bacteriophytochrome)
MLFLVNDLFAVSVIESEKLELDVQPSSLTKLLLDRIRLSSVIAGKKGIVISYDAEDLPDVPFDSKRIAQVIDNLIGNAIKFSPSGSKINVKSCRHGNMVSVSITNSGAGIPVEELSKLFNEFQPLSHFVIYTSLPSANAEEPFQRNFGGTQSSGFFGSGGGQLGHTAPVEQLLMTAPSCHTQRLSCVR